MRHQNRVKKLGRTAAHRKATFRNLASAIIQHKQIKTTLAKAKAARSVVERLITYGKQDTVAARRLAFKVLQNHGLVQSLFNEIAPTFADRSGGYTRIVRLGGRHGDGAEMAVLQLVGFEPMIIEEKKKSAAKKAKKKADKKEREAAEQVEAKEAAAEETSEPAEETEKSKGKKAKAKAKPATEKTEKEADKKKAEPKSKAEEKVEETPAETAKETSEPAAEEAKPDEADSPPAETESTEEPASDKKE